MEKKEHKSAFGIYATRYEADNAVDALKDAGFRNNDISVLMSSKSATEDFANVKETKAPEGAATGAATGAVAGAGLGWLVGIGALAIPGIGPFVAAGPIMAALAGAGVGGAVLGLTGALIGMGIPEYEAKRFDGILKDGGILLSVHTDSSEWQKKAKEVLERTGARDISIAGEKSTDEKKSNKDDGFTGTTPGLRSDTPSSAAGDDYRRTEQERKFGI